MPTSTCLKFENAKPADVTENIGTEENPYILKNANDFIKLSKLVADGNTFENEYFEVKPDSGADTIYLSDFIPIGSNTKPFYGNFNGNDIQINLEIDKPNIDYVGLFGYFGKGTIENLSVSGQVIGRNKVAGIVAYLNSGIVSNVYNKAEIIGEDYVGGIVGQQNNGTIQKAYNAEDITGENNIGCIVGYIYKGTVKNTYNIGGVIGISYVGGVVGRANGTNSIIQTYNNGNVAGNNSDNCGMIIGYVSGSCSKSNLYYDSSALVNQIPPKGKNKPIKAIGNYSESSNVKGLNAEYFMGDYLKNCGFGTDWLFRANAGNYLYYPQLKVFGENVNARIKTDSLKSVKYDYSDGLGSNKIPFLIRTKADMDKLSEMVLKGNTYAGFYFKVDDGIYNIDLGNFVPIGNGSKNFNGNFDGNYCNFNLSIDTTQTYAGLFGYLNGGALVENLSVSGNVKGKTYVGGIAGQINNGTVQNVYNTAKIEGTGRTAGIAGNANVNGNIYNAYNMGEILGTQYVGGIVGYVYKGGTVKNCYSAGQIAGTSDIGGIIGKVESLSYADYFNLYYDDSVLVNYLQPAGKSKPTTVIGGRADNSSKIKRLTSDLMFGDSLVSETYGFDINVWTCLKTTENIAYYPQLKGFGENTNKKIVERSLQSVKNNIKNGLGTEKQPFIIRNADDMNKLRENVELGNTYEGFYFKVILDNKSDTLDLGDFTPIGITKDFYGSFDGNDTQFILNINRPKESNLGLFGHFGKGTIKNLSVKGTVKGKNYVGGIVGYMYSGTLENVYNLANIAGYDQIGGVAGRLSSGKITNVYNMGKITGTHNFAGGVLGYNCEGTLTVAYNVGDVIGADYVGGIVGGTSNHYSITYCYNKGNVAANSITYLGAIVGDINNSYTLSRLYYDLSVLENYTPPKGKVKPTRGFGDIADSTYYKGLEKPNMIGNGLEKYNFVENWIFRDIEGKWGYYAQLKVFANSENERVKNESMLSVRTAPFLGDGTENNPYIISTVEEFLSFANSITAKFDAADMYYMVAELFDFDLTEEEFNCVGNENAPFNGHFDGSFANFILDIETANDYVGLFANVGSKGSVINLSVTGSIKGKNNVGGVAGSNAGTISNVYSTVQITAGDNVGGIIGYNMGSLNIAYNTGIIQNCGSNVGGVVGKNGGTVEEVYNAARVNGTSNIGGVVGYEYNESTVTKAYYDSTVIEFFNQKKGIKPKSAIGNAKDSATVKGLEKDCMNGVGIIGTGANQLEFDLENWVDKETNGMYNYYLQIVGFGQNIDSEIVANSVQSVRVVRFDIGNGSEEDPFIIRDKYDMKILSDISQNDSLVGICFKVIDGVVQIDLSEEELEFKSIGTVNKQFRGGFDGNNTNFVLNIIKITAQYVGMFSYLGEGSNISNLSVSGNVEGNSHVGGIAGYALKSNINNVHNGAKINGTTYVGGIVGYANLSTIDNCYNLTDIEITGNYLGGIASYANNSKISHTFNYGALKTNSGFIGGIVGRAEKKNEITYSYNRNNIIAKNNYVGGIIGYSYDTVTDNCYSAGLVRGNVLAYIGGIVGRVNGNTSEENCYYDSSIIEADMSTVGNKPIRSVGNKLDQPNLRGIVKSYITGEGIIDTSDELQTTLLKLNPDEWVLVANEGIDAYYPQLKAFAESDSVVVKQDSLESVKSYIFAGQGQKESPYIIVNEKDMQILSEFVAKGNDFNGIYFKVRDNAQEFDMTKDGINYKPIGDAGHPFNGIFDGSGTNFLVDLKGDNYQGLFGHIGENAEVYQFSVSGNVQGKNYVGSIAGLNKGKIHTVYSIANVHGVDYVGGLVGYNEGLIETVYYIANLESSGSYSGGLVGYNKAGSIKQGYSVANIAGNKYIGGIIGYHEGIGVIDYLYYNTSIIEISDVENARKPFKAISNLDDTEICKGALIEEMSSGILGEDTNALNLDAEIWTPLKPFGFDIYYSQIKYFSDHDMEKVRENSKSSVTIDRFTEGDGSEDNPYIIRTAMDMKAVSDLVTTSLKTLLGKYFKVADGIKEIDLTIDGVDYKPIGKDSCYFEGNFDGNGTKFIIDYETNGYYSGLFGFVGKNAIIKNIAVDGNLKGNRFVGGIAGRNRGIIENCYNLADVTAQQYYAGGIAGYNENIIRNCFNAGNITTIDYYYAGGIVGQSIRNSIIETCYNLGDITSDSHYVGGIVGRCDGKIANTYSRGQVSGNNVGGVAGYLDSHATIFNSYYDKSIISLSELSKKPSRTTGNVVDGETFFGVSTSQLTGDNLYDIVFDADNFVLTPNENFTAYYPQISIFANSELEYVKSDSLQSVTSTIFQGEGTEEKPYYIFDELDMKALADLMLQNVETDGKYFKVYNKGDIFDLSQSDLNYFAIGNEKTSFNGIFDGNYSKFKLNIDTIGDYQGLFGNVGETAVIKNLEVMGNVIGGKYTGAIVGKNSGKIINAKNSANVKGNGYVGGLIGYNKGELTDSRNKGVVTGTANYVGGLIGYNADNCNIIYCYNFGEVNSTSDIIGGLTGYNGANSNITYSFNHGDVVSTGKIVGGIAGINKGKIEFVYNTADVISSNETVGGIVAQNIGTISEAYHSGETRATDKVGGIASENTGTIERVYYNLYEIETMIPIKGTMAPNSAVFGIENTETVKGLSLEMMTGLEAIGEYEDKENMEFTLDEWSLKEGLDFTSYFPEMQYFKNHEDEKIKEDSLTSVTDKKFEGSGTKDDPFLIYDGFDMRTIGNFVNKRIFFTNKYFRVADGVTVIDLTYPALNYQPIGDDQNRFDGIIDGMDANFVINLDHEDIDYQGIFHTLGANAVIKNMSVSGQVIGKSYVGGLAGRSAGTIENVINNATIKSFDGNNGGGITGLNGGTITNCINKGSVTINGTYVGGIAGENTKNIKDSYNKGTIKGVTNVGGITGRNFEKVTSCYNNANISGETQIGGIVGENDYYLNNCFNMGKINATIGIAGGIAAAQRYRGYGNNPELYDVYNTGRVISGANLAGGIIGDLIKGKIYNSYNGGDISGLTDVGAIVGRNDGGSVSRSYYDLNRLENFATAIGIKPEKAVSNNDDNSSVKGMFHGQMAGTLSIGRYANQMNFSHGGVFIATPSFEKWSFYPQLKVFSESILEEVREDSLESVRALTFIMGEGTEDDPYIIMSESDVISLAETVNSGNEYENTFFMVSPTVYEFNFYDDETSRFFKPIGNQNYSFKGDFNGNGANFNFDISLTQKNTALFGHIGKGGKVYGLSISGSIAGRENTAGVAAINDGIVKNVYNQATITGRNKTAGIVAQNNSRIMNVYNRGYIKGYQYVGGIAGYMDGYITNSYNTGVIYGTKDIGTIGGFLNTGLVLNSFYDSRILGAYRSYGSYLKPERGVSNSVDSRTVKHLDKQFMTGVNAIGSGEFQINFNDKGIDWSVDYNIDGQENYPQLRVFSRSSHKEVKELSKQSTLTTLYKIKYDYNGATDKNTVEYDYAIAGKYFGTNIPFRFGFEFVSWDLVDENLDHTKITNEKGLSLKPFNYDQDITLVAQWKVAEHTVRFIDGDGNIIHREKVLHGDIVKPTDKTPTKSPSRTAVFFFEKWDFDFSQMILKDTDIRATYTAKDRYYKVEFLDGNGQFFKEIKVEYGHKAKPVSDIPTKRFVDNTAYKFVGWEFNFDTEIYKSYSINSIFEAVDRWYTVRFENYDGSLLDEQVVEYRKAADAPSFIPEREPTISSTFEFNGWDKDFDCVEEHMTIKAQYTENIRHYTVKFFDGNGELFNEQSIAYGEAAAEPYGIPLKASHDDVAYKFIGWNGLFDSVTEDMEIHAEYVPVDRYYQVIFANYDGSVLDIQTVEYLHSATEPETEPIKEPTEKYAYNFIGWDKPFDMIESNMTVTAQFEEVLRPFSVKFIDGNGNVFNEQTVVYGQDAMIPSGVPGKASEGDFAFKFTGWDGNGKNIISDTEINAQFTPVQRYYIVTFLGYDKDIILKSERVEYNQSATAPVAPIQPHPNIRYENYFVKWDADFSHVTSDMVINAVYSTRLKTFDVTFVNGDETTTQKVNYGSDAKAPTPHKTGDSRISYEFVGWDREFTNVTENIVVTALFNEIYNYYIVKFIDGDGIVMSRQEVLKGDDAIAPKSPTKSRTETKVFVFTGWDKSYKNVTADLEVTALFKEAERYNLVTFKDDLGVTISEQVVEYGQSAIAPEPPEKLRTEKYEYKFVRWDGDFSHVTAPLTIRPVYEEVIRKFEVIFIDGDNNICNKQMIAYGQSAVTPKDPMKTPTDDYVFLFMGWDRDYSTITSDTEVRSIFTEIDRWYRVTFVGKDSIILDEQVIEYGKNAVDPRPKLPVKVIDDNYIYAITAWDRDFKNITSDITVNAIYDTVDRWYTVKFFDDDKTTLLKEERIEYGHDATPPEDPQKESDETYRYNFIGWDGNYKFITQNTRIYAKYEKFDTKYTVKFIDGNGNLFDEQIVYYGEDAEVPDGIPTRVATPQYSFKFIGWDKPLDNVMENRVIYAQFEKQIRSYTVRFVDTEGRLLKEQTVEYGQDAIPPEGLTVPDPTDEFEYEIAWDNSYKNITEDMEIRLYYKEVVKEYTYIFRDAQGNVIKKVTAKYGTTIVKPKPPVKEKTEKYVYTFLGWSPEVPEKLTRNIEFDPFYEDSIREYKVTFLDGDGEVFEEQFVPFGSNGKLPDSIPEKSPTKQYYYKFKMWESKPISVRTDLTIRSIYYEYLQLYTVTFVDEKDNVLKVQQVPYGTGATEPTPDMVPKKTDTPKFTFTFVGWSRPFSNITEDITVKTVYIGIPRTYTYTFYDDDGVTILKQISGMYGSKIVAPPNPTKKGTASTTFVFKGWDKVVADTLTHDIDYYAVYKEVPKEFTVIFYDGDGFALDVQKVNYGETAVPPEKVPTRIKDDIYEYVFESWIEDYTNITSDLKVHPKFVMKLREFSVKFVNYDNTVKEVFIQYGKSAFGKVITPQRPGYRFVDWDKDITVIKHDMVVYAKFIPNQYQINFHPENADTGYMEPIIASFDSIVSIPKNNYEREGYYFVGWVINKDSQNPVYFKDEDSFKLTSEGLDLYARWIPIVYNINYFLNGGEAVNPDSYTIEDEIVLNEAYKENYKFTGWYTEPQKGDDDNTMPANFIPMMFAQMGTMPTAKANIGLDALPDGEPIKEIPKGNTGNIELYAHYKYDGYIVLHEKSELTMCTANGLETTLLETREFYDENNPIYLQGVFLGQTVENLRQNFVNENLVFLNKDGEVAEETDAIGTGWQIVLYNEQQQIRDKVIIVLMGDLDGNGYINMNDFNLLDNHIKKAQLMLYQKLAANLRQDDYLNMNDFNILDNHVSGKALIHDKNKTTTMRE